MVLNRQESEKTLYRIKSGKHVLMYRIIREMQAKILIHPAVNGAV